MKKLLIILACVCFCAVGCKQKTAPVEPQTTNETESAETAICQSCCMPLSEGTYGTDADGSVNYDYCSYCYENGKFVAPDLTMEEMIAICVPYMVEQGMQEEDALSILENTLPKLKRWQ